MSGVRDSENPRGVVVIKTQHVTAPDLIAFLSTRGTRLVAVTPTVLVGGPTGSGMHDVHSATIFNVAEYLVIWYDDASRLTPDP